MSRRSWSPASAAGRLAASILVCALVVPALNAGGPVSVAGSSSLASYGRQSTDIPPARGKFLVASRKINDPDFKRTVVLILAHGERGTTGVIVNRPTAVSPSEALPEIKGVKRHKGKIHQGGPVGQDRFLLLLNSAEPPDGFRHVFGAIHVGDSREALELALSRRRLRNELRLFAGYSGWGPGQLGRELARGDWHVMTADSESIFAKDPTRVWRMLVPPDLAPRPDLVTLAALSLFPQRR